MVLNGSLETRKSSASIEAHDKKFPASKTSDKIQKSTEEGASSKRPKSSSGSEVPRSKKSLRPRSKTAESGESTDKNKPHLSKSDFSKATKKKNSEKSFERKSESTLKNKNAESEEEEGQRCADAMTGPVPPGTEVETQTGSDEREGHGKRSSVPGKGSRSSESPGDGTGGKAAGKRQSEIPKLRSLARASPGTPPRAGGAPSKLPVKLPPKESEPKPAESQPELPKVKGEGCKSGSKANRGKSRESRTEEKVKEAMKEDFSSLVPLYESELKKITEVWVNTIYCSLTMRTNLVKLLFQAFPHLNRSQFQAEDERLLHCIAHARNYTRSEAENLIQFIRSVVSHQEKAKEQYNFVMSNKEIADIYNHDWRRLTRKIAEISDETKQLQMEAPELQKKKEANEVSQREKIRSMEAALGTKEEEFQKLTNQLNVLKKKESTYKGSILMKVQDYKDIKTDVIALRSMEKEFEELKAKYLCQNELYEKKIKDLELLLEEKKKVLDREKEVKKQLQVYMGQVQAQQKRLATTIGKEQIDYVLGTRRSLGRDKRREQLWTAAVKLVLRGFFIQMKKLERDKNKMLLQLQSDDVENLNKIARSIIQKENFIKSIKHQMHEFQKAPAYCARARTPDPS